MPQPKEQLTRNMTDKECMMKETITKTPIINKTITTIEATAMKKIDIIMIKELIIRIAKIMSFLINKSYNPLLWFSFKH